MDSFKLIIIGNSCVGKSAILYRFTENKFIDTGTTIGVDYANKIINTSSKTVNCHIWDTAGQEVYESITTNYYRNAAGALLVFDLTDKRSFLDLELWIKRLNKNIIDKTPIVLVGNKCDLKNKNIISKDEIENFCKKYKFKYFEVSAKQDINIKTPFVKLVEIIYKLIEEKQVDCNNNREYTKIKLANNKGNILDQIKMLNLNNNTNNNNTNNNQKNKSKCCYK